MSFSFRQVWELTKTEFLLEWRQKYALFGMLLYVASTIFILYIAINHPQASVWNALFWIVILFITVNSVARSFLQESRARMLYYYTIAGAREFMLSKLLYNLLLMVFIGVASLGLYIVFLGNPLINPLFYVGMVCLGGMSFSLVFSMLSAIAAKAGQNAALMAIMGFPIVIPMIMILVRATQTGFAQVYQPGLTRMIGMLLGLDLLVIALSLVLFPFLWRN